MFSGAQFLGCKTGGWQPSAKIALVCLYRVSGSSSPLLFFATNQYFHGGNMRVSELFSCQEYFHVRNVFLSEIWECQKYFHVRNIFMPGIFSWWKYEFVRNKIFRALLSITCTTMFCQLGMRSSFDYKTTIFCGTDSLLHWKMGPWNDNRGWN